MDWGGERPLSPESSITTLMSCSGHLPPPHLAPHTVRCGDQEFASASAALDAYIAHFERWRLVHSTGPRLDLLPPRTPQPGPPRPPGTLRNRDVLSELLTDTELCFLSLPATSSLRCRANGDELALTTEELLAIPSDGSLPVTKTTAYLTDLHHRSRCRRSNNIRPQPAVPCGPMGRAKDQSHTPSPTIIRRRVEDMLTSDLQAPVDRKCLSRQEVTRLQNSQTVGPVIGADCLSSSHFSDSSQLLGSPYYGHSSHRPGHAHSVQSSHFQSPTHILRSNHSLNMIGHTQFGHAHPRQRMDGELATGPVGFWENAEVIPEVIPEAIPEVMSSAVERTDELVREYLTYRGFSSALRHLDTEIKADRERGLRVDRIVEQLLQLVLTFDLPALRDYWAHLERRLFSRLQEGYAPAVAKLTTSLYRYYVVNTIQKGNQDKTQEFFQRLGAELQGAVEWRDWFALPFIVAPEQNPAFALYFSRQWADTFLVSLHNFLSALFQCMHILGANTLA
ncbi:unnamed protein product [Merluccius merluccius]